MFWNKKLKELKAWYGNVLTEGQMHTIDLWEKERVKGKKNVLQSGYFDGWTQQTAQYAIEYADKAYDVFMKKEMLKDVALIIATCGVAILIFKGIDWHYCKKNEAKEIGYAECLMSVKQACEDSGKVAIAQLKDNGNGSPAYIVANIITDLPSDVSTEYLEPLK